MIEELKALQKKISQKIRLIPLLQTPKYIAGIDVGYFSGKNLAQAVIVVMNFPEFKIIEIQKKVSPLSFPYVPGFLAFRELPIILEAFQNLKTKPDLLIIDGQGIAHPRRAGIAVHLGVEIGLPTIGCAKKPLLKLSYDLAQKRGAKFPIYFQEEIVGYVVRTQSKVKPVFVSPGHLITVDEAVEWILKTATKFRLPEPLRLAHLFSKTRD
ncbi:MAG: deoxyribonuclease V [Thermodesulfobacterium sp.]|nr:deoxyribonuclease V [Thermodesulfobacterium sp.]